MAVDTEQRVIELETKIADLLGRMEAAANPVTRKRGATKADAVVTPDAGGVHPGTPSAPQLSDADLLMQEAAALRAAGKHDLATRAVILATHIKAGTVRKR